MKKLLLAVLALCLSATLVMPLQARGDEIPALVTKQVERHAASLNLERIEKRIHELVNLERKKHGLPALKKDKGLVKVARRHSKDMAQRNYFSHDTPEGLDVRDRYERDGLACALHAGGENIANQYVFSKCWYSAGDASCDWASEDNIAEATVKGWMNSKGHRNNILETLWKEEGIGVFIKGDGAVFITQNFC